MTDTLLHIFPSFAKGSAQAQTVDLANSILSDKRHIFVSLDRDFGAAEGLQSHVHHALLSVGRRRRGRLDLDNLKMFRRLVAERQPTALLTYNWGAIEAALANRIAPLCAHLHFEDGSNQDEVDGRQRPKRVWTRRIALSGRSAIVVPSKALFDVARSIWRFRETRLHYIPHGVDCARFEDVAIDRGLSLRKTDDEVLIGAVGDLSAERNVARLLRLFAGLTTTAPRRLVIMGDGPERAALEDLAKDLGIETSVCFLGAQTHPDSMFKQLDIFTLTADTDQAPNGLIEAMAAGLPVLATDVGDVASTLSKANQPFLAPPEAEDLLKTQLQRLIERPDLRSTIADLNQRHARERFDRQAILERYHRLFSTLIPSG